jgi:UDP-N-acetylmuramate--alanine ligase
VRKRSELSLFSPTSSLEDCTRIFMVGIGGAGMSGLARMLHRRGIPVAGTDAAGSPSLEALRALGIEATVGHSGEGIRDGDGLVLSDAINIPDSPEAASAKEKGLPLFRRSQLLGWLLKGKRQICVTGTHGKTTTTGMIGSALAEAGLDPLVIVGADIPQFGGPIREGAGSWAVVEACEAYESYLDLSPDAIVLTNLDLDHVDFHESWENLVDSVRSFVRLLPENGAIAAARGGGAEEALQPWSGQVNWVDPDSWPGPELAVPGRHNRTNAACALAVCQALGIAPDLAAKGISTFVGAERRLQVLLDGPVTAL